MLAVFYLCMLTVIYLRCIFIIHNLGLYVLICTSLIAVSVITRRRLQFPQS